MLAALCLPFIVLPPAQAKEAEYIGGDPEMQARVMRISAELRCLVCQGQSLADSNADFAKDMRSKVRNLMAQGMSDREVIDFMTERYGDTIRYRPPFKSTTVLLWFGPFILLGLGIAVLYFNLYRRRKQVEDVPLTEEEHRRAEALLRGESKAGSGEDKA